MLSWHNALCMCRSSSAMPSLVGWWRKITFCVALHHPAACRHWCAFVLLMHPLCGTFDRTRVFGRMIADSLTLNKLLRCLMVVSPGTTDLLGNFVAQCLCKHHEESWRLGNPALPWFWHLTCCALFPIVAWHELYILDSLPNVTCAAWQG